jgi:hypothetical protein
MRTTMAPDGPPELAVRKTAIGKRGAYAKQMQ